MALIKCPECGKKISDKSNVCINCGCPIKKQNLSIINGTEYNLSFLLDETYPEIAKINDLIKLTNGSLSEINKIVKEIEITKKIPSVINIPSVNDKIKESNIPHCPKCGSTNIQMVPRKWSLLTGFMTNKTDRVCVNCKHKF